ncbi:MAG: RNA polymerase factor sigma-54 [Pseudomonadota bacterium]
MSLSLRLDVRQSQSLVMTPQLQQAIKLLQLGNLELSTYVQGELEQNPFLERQEDSAEPAAEQHRADSTADEPPADAPLRERELNGSPEMAPLREVADTWVTAPDEGWTDRNAQDSRPGLDITHMGPGTRGKNNDFSDERFDVEERVSRPKSLREHLVEQLQVDLPAGPERVIGLHLIEQVNESGYLTGDLDDIAIRLGCPLTQVEAVLDRLQQCDPPGVFARSVKECLALQLREANRLDPAMAALLDNLRLLAQANLDRLLKVCGVLPDDLPDMIAELKALNPKPGLAFATEVVEAVVPDVFVLPAQGGGWRVELNGATLPRVLVNTAYYAELNDRAVDKRAKEYLAERFQSASWLVKALDQRARTVLKVAEAVVTRQLGFLNHGVQHLRPLVLRDIAEATELHESTISRATADKYVATPRGNYPFKYFFSNALPGTAGEASHAAEAIRQQVKAMIDREDPERVLSDDQIVTALRASGVSIARRTVAKYRESLAIPSSVERRRSKALRLA